MLKRSIFPKKEVILLNYFFITIIRIFLLAWLEINLSSFFFFLFMIFFGLTLISFNFCIKMAFTTSHVSLKGQWTSFFEEADIPTADAEKYGEKFASEKILLKMLPDLNEEHLKSMGITLLGYKIAILKHAKKVIEKNPDLSSYEVPTKKEPPCSKPAVEPVVKEQPKIVKAKQTNRKNLEVNGHKAPEAPTNVRRKIEKTDPPAAVKVVATPTAVSIGNTSLNTDDIEEIEEIGFVKKPLNANNGTKIVRTINSKNNSIMARKMTSTVVRSSNEKRDDNGTSNAFVYSDDDDDNVNVTINDSAYCYNRTIAKNNVAPDTSRKCTFVVRKGIFSRLGEETSQPKVTSTTQAGDEDSYQSNRIVLAEKTIFDRLDKRIDKSSIDDKSKTSFEVEKTDKPIVLTRNSNSNEVLIKTIKIDVPVKTEFQKRLTNPPGTREVKSVLESNVYKRKIDKISGVRGKVHRSLYMDAEEGRKKRVTFKVSSNNIRTIPSRAEAIRNGEIPDPEEKERGNNDIPVGKGGVFLRLSMRPNMD